MMISQQKDAAVGGRHPEIKMIRVAPAVQDPADFKPLPSPGETPGALMEP
jgi:hypothetical protein